MKFSLDMLNIDAGIETERIVQWLWHNLNMVLRRRGVVVGISGGIDSSVVLALAVRCFGAEKVTALIMPEEDSEPESEDMARRLAKHYAVKPILENITPVLAGYACYERRDEAIKRLFPQYDPKQGYKAKICLPDNLLDQDSYNIYSLVVICPDGQEMSKRLSLHDYLQIVAASNFKQRARMSLLYYHAELRHYAVLGTANKNEHEQGFFVKHGDGGADLKPIAHLYKTQVYQLAEYLNIPKEIRERIPTTDTYSANQTQEEFFFRLPFKLMDLLWYAQQHQIPITEVSSGMNLTVAQVQRAYDEFTRKQRTTEYLRMAALNLEMLKEPENLPL